VELLRAVPFFSGYAVEIGLLIDLSRHAGLGALAQVDLGDRTHLNQPTAALGTMASAIAQAVLRRVAEEGRGLGEGVNGTYARPVRANGGYVLGEVDTRPRVRPPMAEVASVRV
jgi:glucosyl-3-phosphoglycerate synthase